jgi:protein-S-isoprenylcysteine O-methyltransferase Ste14
MSSKFDWMVVAGFLLAALGLFLRILIMMRSSDAHPANATPKVGRELVRSYGSMHPKSKLPLLMWASISAGFILLIAGFLLAFR